jgi:hypothetical protein
MKKLYSLIAALSLVLFAACTFPSPSRASTTAVLLPQSDGNYAQLIPSAATSVHFTMVNESLCNGVTNYNSTSTTTKRDSYRISVASIGDGALISKVAVVPCASRNLSGTTGNASSTMDLFYRFNGSDSSATGSYALAANTIPAQLATSTYSSLNLFKTSTSTLEIGAIYTSGSKGVRLSRLATVLTYTVTVPSAPSALVATNVSSTENDLAWTDNSNNELGFKIYRSQNGGSYSQVATTATWNVASYSDTGLATDQTYSYEVVAYNSAGTATSNISSAVTASSVPTPPSNLTAVTSSSDVILTWADNSSNETGFKIERSADNVAYSQIATTVANLSSTTSYKDVAAAGTAYYYRVKAYNALGSSTYATAVEGIYKFAVTGVFADTTWTPASIYYISGTLSVTGSKLTIQAGTVVKFNPGLTGISVTGTGALSVQGTGAGPVYLTSYLDDSVGGDTNNDTTSTAPAAGNWDMVSINYGASTTIDHAVVRYGGHNAAIGSDIYVNGGTLTLSNSEVATG